MKGAITPFVNRTTQDFALALTSELLFASTNPINGTGVHTPYTLHPTPYTLHPTLYTLHPTPYT